MIPVWTWRGGSPREARRTEALASAVALLVLLASWSTDLAGVSLARQDDAATPIEVGSGPAGERSLNFSGREVYRADTIELYGVVTALVGLDAALLSVDGTATPQAARFTYSGEIGIADASSRGDVTTTAGSGTLRVYFNDGGGATWDDPASFAGGDAVAEWSIDLWNTVQRQSPGVGVVVGAGQMTQTDAQQFVLGGEDYRFGKTGIEQRLRYVGALMSSSEPGVAAMVGLSGGVNVTANEVRPVILGGPAAPAQSATPAAAEQACPDLDLWLQPSRGALDRAAALAAAFLAPGGLDDLDQDALGAAVTEINGLVDAQRAAAIPENAAGENRLIVTALSTTARGLLGMASAARAEDAALLEQGRGVLADGASLIGRASDALAALSTGCATAG